MAARNHITRIRKADEVAKGTEEVERKATAETKESDPKNAENVITENVSDLGEIDGNGSGIKFTTRAAKEADVAKKEEKVEFVPQSTQKNIDKAVETEIRPQDITNPALSQERNAKKK